MLGHHTRLVILLIILLLLGEGAVAALLETWLDQGAVGQADIYPVLLLQSRVRHLLLL